MTEGSENLPVPTSTNAGGVPTSWEAIPASVITALSGVPAALMPQCLKALDRLIGGLTDIPVALLEQQKAKINAQTQAYTLVESEIGKAVATEAAADPELVRRAVNVLVRKSYRKQGNREAVAAAAIEEIRRKEASSADEPVATQSSEVGDDWLNVFERYAEDATSDRMQELWGRVLAGEVRAPGRYSMRTLRFLSEFSQSDAREFSEIAKYSFDGLVPASLVKRDGDISNLLALEAAGLMTGGYGLGLTKSIDLKEGGLGYLFEEEIALGVTGPSGYVVRVDAIALTPLGCELVSLLPGRDGGSAARLVGLAIAKPPIKEIFLVAWSAGREVGERTTIWSALAPG